VKFWDASSVVPLLVAEPQTAPVQALAAGDRALLVWWGTRIECTSAVARLEREGALDADAVTQALDRLKELAAGWHEVDPGDAVREAAARFLRVHTLRPADAIQLAAAFVAAGGRPVSIAIVTLDDRLAAAARKEGFSVIVPA
jgi:uncharacterized protein